MDSLGGFPHPPRVGAGRIKAIQLEYSEARRTMTNALRKAPQHTAVGFKQTVSGEGAGPPWAGSETPRGWDLTGLGCRTSWDVRPHGVWFGTSQLWDILGAGLGLPWMSGPMESGPLGFGTSQGQVQGFPGLGSMGTVLAPSRMRSETPRVGLCRDRCATSQGVGPCRDDRCGTS